MLHEHATKHATKHAMEHGTPKLTGWPTGSQGVAAEQGVCALSSWIVVHEDAIHSSWFEWLFRVSGAVSLFIVFSFSVSNNRVIISQVLSGLKAAFLKKMKRRAICNLCYDMRGYKVG